MGFSCPVPLWERGSSLNCSMGSFNAHLSLEGGGLTELFTLMGPVQCNVWLVANSFIALVHCSISALSL